MNKYRVGMVKDISRIDGILAKAFNGEHLSESEIVYLLDLKDENEIQRLFYLARSLRRRYFGDKIFLYGFLYFSTWCRNNCSFCFYRTSNTSGVRYRKKEREILEAAEKLCDSGVHLVDLTMGEDPRLFSDEGFNTLAEIIKKVKGQTGLPVMVSPGAVPDHALREIAGAGADWYACYQETHNRKIFGRLRLGQNYQERMGKKIYARELGMLVEEGILTGVGDSSSDVAASISVMKELGCQQVRVMSFIPQKGTPMENIATPPRIRELLVIAVLRLTFPDRLIPASLDVDGIKGLQARLDAGANVVTSIIPPRSGLAGVSQNSLDIEEGYRTVSGVLPVLTAKGLVPASAGEYRDWVGNQKEKLVH